MKTKFFLLALGLGGAVGLLPPAQAQQSTDFGDAPSPYPTLLSQNGARHLVVQGVFLGALVDAEADSQPNANGTGDDSTPVGAPDDEDGVAFVTLLVPGSAARVQVVASRPGFINAWMDFNTINGWADAGEQIFSNAPVAAGTNLLGFTVSATARLSSTFARFRYTTNAVAGLSFVGQANNGEVEDYQVNVLNGQDFGDAPPPYPTLLSQNGARHVVDPSFCLGFKIDGEADGQPNADATGDDANPATANDEDGVTFLTPLSPGQGATVQVVCTIPAGVSGRLSAWLDFNANGTWADAGEQIIANAVVVGGTNSFNFLVPTAAVTGQKFARFRLSRQGDLSFVGLAQDGEVEDYHVTLAGPQDFGDAPAPYPTLLKDNGARHTILQGFQLGARVDAEGDGQPNATATGDDLNGPDEDGVAFTSPLVPGRTATVVVTASQTGFLNAWIDFNINGTWAEASDQIFSARLLAPGANPLSFPVPTGAKLGTSFARFRFSRQQVLPFDGPADDGEVEDYQVRIIPDRERCDLSCAGRDFWLTFPGNYAPDADNPVKPGFCIVGAAGVTGTVSIAGLSFSTTFTIPASLAARVALPTAADLGDLNGGITNMGIHVTANGDVQIYAISKVNFTSDSYLALPSSILGKDYIILGYGNVHTNVPPINGSQFAIVACESNTAVNILPSSTAIGGPFNIVLQPGDTYQLRDTNGRPADLTGTIVSANKPIAIFGSHQCANIPSSNVWFCDYIVEQLLPVNTWGNTFHTAPLASRSGGDTFRVLAGQDATSVFLNGVPIGTIDRGKFLQLLLSVGARITADKPVLVAQYANSADFDPPAGSFSQGDPFMCLVQATRHYDTSYTVCSFTNGFGANFLNIIAPVGSVGTVQLNGGFVGGGAFTAILGSGYAYARVAVTAGRNTVTAGAPFGLYAYGWAEYESYGHPACFFVGDVQPPTVTTSTTGGTNSVNNFPNTPGFVPTPDVATGTQVQDNCDPQPGTPTQTPRPGTLLPPGVHTVTVSAQDLLGNLGLANFIFTVLDPSPVIISCPSNRVVNCVSNNGAIVNFTVTAHSTYDTNVPVVSTPASGSFFPAGTTVVTNVATSLAGLSNSCSFTVTVLCDTRVRVTRTNNNLSLSWSGPGTLQFSPRLTGPWSNVVSGVSFYNTPASGQQGYFRVQF